MFYGARDGTMAILKKGACRIHPVEFCLKSILVEDEL